MRGREGDGNSATGFVGDRRLLWFPATWVCTSHFYLSHQPPASHWAVLRCYAAGTVATPYREYAVRLSHQPPATPQHPRCPVKCLIAASHPREELHSCTPTSSARPNHTHHRCSATDVCTGRDHELHPADIACHDGCWANPAPHPVPSFVSAGRERQRGEVTATRDGNWTTLRLLGPKVRSELYELVPVLTPKLPVQHTSTSRTKKVVLAGLTGNKTPVLTDRLLF